MTDNFKRKILPIIILLVGIIIMIAMASFRTDIPKKEAKRVIPLVKTMLAKIKKTKLKITGSGIVRSIAEVQLRPQISGKVIYRSPKMSTGSSFEKGDLLYKIDPSDYIVQRDIAEAEVATRKVQIEMERQESQLAKEEWKDYQKENPSEKASSLTLRKPQMDLAIANLKAAEARLTLAKLNLSRTKLKAPFDGSVQNKRADIGQLVNSGTVLAEIVSTERAEVTIYLDPSNLNFFDFEKKNKAIISKNESGIRYEWDAFLKKGGKSLDPKSRLIAVTIDILNPYKSDHPLLIGTYVDVKIDGKEVKNVFEVPRHILHQNKIWLLKNNKLFIRTLHILHNSNNISVISEGLKDGDKIIVSNLDIAVDGMQLKSEQE